jgi:hypothetical protein
MVDLTAKKRDDLPDSKFAYVDEHGVGHLPIHDAAHVRNALARFDQTDMPEDAKAGAMRKIRAAAKRFGVDVGEGDEESAREAASTDDMPATAGNTQMMSVFSEEHHHGAVHHSHPHYHGGPHEDHDEHTHCPDCGSDARLCGHKAAQAALEKAAGMVSPSQTKTAREAADTFLADRAALHAATTRIAAAKAGMAGDDALVREAQTAPRSNRVRVRFMTAGPGNRKDGHHYTPEAVQALVPLIKQQPKMFLDHSLPSQVRERGHRALAELAGIAVRESVRYDPATQATVGDVVLRPKMAEYIETAREAGDTIGVSIDGVGTFRSGPHGKECTGWAGFHSADFVPAGGAGGFTLDVREADSPALAMQEREFTMSLLDDLTPQEVRETAYDLYEAIGREYAAQNGAASTGQQTGAPPAEVERLVRENAALAARLDALDAERNREQTAGIVRDTITAQGSFSKDQVAFLARPFAGAMIGEKGAYKTPEDLTAAVRETATAYLESLPKERTGYITDLGGVTRGTEGVRESGATVPSADEATFATLDSWVGQAYFNRQPQAAAQG